MGMDTRVLTNAFIVMSVVEIICVCHVCGGTFATNASIHRVGLHANYARGFIDEKKSYRNICKENMTDAKFVLSSNLTTFALNFVYKLWLRLFLRANTKSVELFTK